MTKSNNTDRARGILPSRAKNQARDSKKLLEFFECEGHPQERLKMCWKESIDLYESKESLNMTSNDGEAKIRHSNASSPCVLDKSLTETNKGHLSVE